MGARSETVAAKQKENAVTAAADDALAHANKAEYQATSALAQAAAEEAGMEATVHEVSGAKAKEFAGVVKARRKQHEAEATAAHLKKAASEALNNDAKETTVLA